MPCINRSDPLFRSAYKYISRTHDMLIFYFVYNKNLCVSSYLHDLPGTFAIRQQVSACRIAAVTEVPGRGRRRASSITNT